MLPIPDSEKTKWGSGQYLKELRIIFPDIQRVIYNDEIYGESMTLKESLFDGNGAINVSGCISSQFSIEIRHSLNAYVGQRIIAEIRIDGGAWRQLFSGYVDSVETVRDRSYQKLSCYDVIQYKSSTNVISAYESLNDTFTVKQLRDAVFTYLRINQKTQTLPNDLAVLAKNTELTELAAIDVMRALCQINGMFGIINRDGQFEYRKLFFFYDKLPYPSDDLFPASDLYPGEVSEDGHEYIDAYESVKYEEYEVEPITKVTVRDSSSDEQAAEYGTGTNNYLIEGNPLLSGALYSDKEFIAHNVYTTFAGLSYRPFDTNVIGRPYIEVGDAVSLYIYDYSSGEPVTVLLTFNVLTRNLKGIQWLRDNYTANGAQYQPEVKIERTSGSDAAAIDSIKNDIKEIDDEIDVLNSGKQDFIDLDIQVPTWESTEGHITINKLQETTGGSVYQGYRMEDGEWVKMLVAQFSQTDLTPGETPLGTGEIYLVYE